MSMCDTCGEHRGRCTCSVTRRVPWFREDGREVQRTEIKCQCGEWVLCACFTNICDCGRDYNMSGQLLADRSQWGEETGESASDILMADSDYDDWAFEDRYGEGG